MTTIKLPNCTHDVDELRKALADFDAKPKLCKPEIGETYYWLGSEGTRDTSLWNNDLIDQRRWARGNVFPDNESAEHADRVRIAKVKIERRAAENNADTNVDWGDGGQVKFFAVWDHRLKKWCVDDRLTSQLSPLPHFTNFNDCERFIADCEDELNLVYGIKESR